MLKNNHESSGAPVPRLRLALGVLILVLGFICPIFIPLVALSHFPTTWKIGMSGLLMFGIPELLMLASVAIMGKSGLEYIKRIVFKFLRKHGPPEVVGLRRYRIGLVMFLLPLLFGFLAPYVGHVIPAYQVHTHWFGMAGDLILLASLFVLGGEFWDKLRSLFIYGAKAQFPVGSR